MHKSSDSIRIVRRRQAVEVPVVSLRAEREGPSVAITGNVHGDEFTGVLAAHRLVGHLERDLLAGSVHVYPTLNPPGLKAGSRGVGADGPDLNRCFPGQAGGDLANRLARGVWDDLVARAPELLVDLHADSAQSIPYAIVDRAVRHEGAARRRLDRQLLEHAEATGLTVLREYPDDVYLRFGLDRSLAGAVVNELGVPAVTIEAGPRRQTSLAAVETTVGAVLGVLAHRSMVDAAPEPDESRCTGGPWRRASGPRTTRDGLFTPCLPPGALLEPGEVMGVVRSLRGDVLEEIRAPSQGLVISWSDGGWVEQGTVVATLGIPEGS